MLPAVPSTHGRRGSGGCAAVQVEEEVSMMVGWSWAKRKRGGRREDGLFALLEIFRNYPNFQKREKRRDKREK